MKKRISRKEWTEIGRYNYAAKWLRPLCSYTLIKESDKIFRREQHICWLVYLIIFIPVHILMVFFYMWDSGLKEFCFEKRYLGSDTLVYGSEPYKRAEKIWNHKS